TPLRLTTDRTAVSTVVNRFAQWVQERRRRIAWPSSTSRESITRESVCRQYGHRIMPHSPSRRTGRGHCGKHVHILCIPAPDLGITPLACYPNLWTTYSHVTTRCRG